MKGLGFIGGQELVSESKSPKKILYHTVDLESPDAEEALTQFLNGNRKQIRVTVPDIPDGEYDRLFKIGDIFIAEEVHVHFDTTPLRLATFRDPVTRRKVGFVPAGKKRKLCFEYPDSNNPNDPIPAAMILKRTADPEILRRAALLATPGTLHAYSGDYKLRKYLTGIARKEMWRFKSSRLREPFEELIQAFSAPLPAHVAAFLNGLPD